MKKLDGPRCPWCGTLYFNVPENPHKPNWDVFECFNHYLEFCASCGKRGRYHFLTRGTLLVGILMLILLLLSIPEAVVFLICVALSLPFVHTTAYYRYPDPNKHLTPDERKLCTARFRWYSVKEGGIGLPRLRIYNHMIFPVCFVDGRGRAVTHTGCVRLCKKWFFLYRGAKLRLITEAIDAKKVRAGMKFYIFNGGERIGEGVVEKYLYRPLDGE